MNNTHSNDVISQALLQWTDQDTVLAGVSEVWDAMIAKGTDLGVVFDYIAQAAISYTLTERQRILVEWNPEGSRTEQEWAALQPDPAVMAEMNEAVNQQAINRLFIYLYVHAHLLDVVYGTSPIGGMNTIRERIIVRRR